MGKWWENHGKMVIYMERSPWSTILYGKMMGKPWENGDLYGQIHHFEWEDSLFRLGHVQSQTVSLPEGTGKFRWQIHTVITGKIWQTSGLRFNKLGALKEASSASDSPPLGICSSGVAPSPKSTALVMSTEQRPEKLAETGWSFRGSSQIWKYHSLNKQEKWQWLSNSKSLSAPKMAVALYISGLEIMVSWQFTLSQQA